MTRNITIENHASHRINVFASANEVAVDEGGDILDFSPPSMSDRTVSVTSWLQISGSVLELDPGETMELPLTIMVHHEAKPGIYHAFVGFGSGTNRDIAEKQVRDGVAPGVIVTLSVDQQQTEFLKLNTFVIERFVITADNNAVTYTLKNPGTATVVPRGEIILSDGRGEEVASIKVNSDGEELLPGKEKIYQATIPTEGLLGKYKAFLSVDYGTSQVASVYDTAFFYVVPWKQLLAIFIGILLSVIILSVYFHRRYAVEDDDDEHGAEYVPLYVRESASQEQDHDINLKQK